LLPDVGHTPFAEDLQTTASLLPDFAAAGRHPRWPAPADPQARRL